IRVSFLAGAAPPDNHFVSHACNGGPPRWYVVDLTNASQSKSWKESCVHGKDVGFRTLPVRIGIFVAGAFFVGMSTLSAKRDSSVPGWGATMPFSSDPPPPVPMTAYRLHMTRLRCAPAGHHS